MAIESDNVVYLDGETLSSLQVELVSKGLAKVQLAKSAELSIQKARKSCWKTS